MTLAHWALVAVVVVILLAWGYVVACKKAIDALNWEDEE